MIDNRTNERTNERHVISYRGPVSGAVITGGTMGEHDVRPAAALYQRVLGAGVVARLDLLDAALEQARREGAAAALEAAAAGIAAANPAARGWLQSLAQQHRAAQQ